MRHFMSRYLFASEAVSCRARPFVPRCRASIAGILPTAAVCRGAEAPAIESPATRHRPGRDHGPAGADRNAAGQFATAMVGRSRAAHGPQRGHFERSDRWRRSPKMPGSARGPSLVGSSNLVGLPLQADPAVVAAVRCRRVGDRLPR